MNWLCRFSKCYACLDVFIEFYEQRINKLIRKSKGKYLSENIKRKREITT